MRGKLKRLFFNMKARKNQSKFDFRPIRYILTRDIVVGNTRKTTVLPEFCGKEPGGGIGAQRAAESPLTWLFNK